MRDAMRGLRDGRGGGRRGKVEDDDAALAGRAHDAHATSMGAGDAVHEAETEAEAPGLRRDRVLPAEERLEDVAELVRGDAAAPVLDLDPDGRPRLVQRRGHGDAQPARVAPVLQRV